VFSIKVTGVSQLWFPGFILVKNPSGIVITIVLFSIAVFLAPFAFRSRRA
jgi:hypothetical protein